MAFLGMRGTGDWAANQVPESWREMILLLKPNGMAPLTAIMSKLGSEPVDSYKFHWWTKKLPDQAGDVTNVYKNADLSTAVGAGDDMQKDAVVYAKVAEALASEFRPRHQVKLGKSDDYRHDTTGEVVDVKKDGANSYIAIRLNEDAPTDNGLDGADRINVIGNMNAEGADMPQHVGYDPVEFTNLTQIFRTPLSITRTARKTRLRTGDAYQEMKREALELLSIEMEKALLWSVQYSGTGDNGKPIRTMDGIIKSIRTNASGNVESYALTSDSDFDGKTWLQGGEDWLDKRLEEIFRFGSTEKLAFVGSEALRAINRLAKASGQISLTPMTASYGLKVIEWVTPFGVVFLKTHPLFSYDSVNRRNMLIFEPANLKSRIIDDIFFVADPNDNTNRNNSRDSTEEEWIYEGSLEYHFPETNGYLIDLGQDNA